MLTALVLLLLPSLAVAEPVVTVYLGRPLPTILLHLYQRASLGYNDSSISKIVGTRTQRERRRGTDMHTYSRSLQEGGQTGKSEISCATCIKGRRRTLICTQFEGNQSADREWEPVTVRVDRTTCRQLSTQFLEHITLWVCAYSTDMFLPLYAPF